MEKVADTALIVGAAVTVLAVTTSLYSATAAVLGTVALRLAIGWNTAGSSPDDTLGEDQ